MKTNAKLASGLLLAGLSLSAGFTTAGQTQYAGYSQPWGYGHGYMPGAYPPPPPMPMMMPPQRMPYGYNQPRYPSSAQQSPSRQTATTNQETSQTASESARIVISQMRFDPAVVTVQKGAEVTWNQRDAMPHTIKANDNSFVSPRLTNNGEFSHVFDKSGSYTYYCSIHPSMRGEIRVVE
jgi:plastocyanin